MDFDQAVNSHVQWKIKLRTAIANKQALDAATITRDDQCALGQWIKGAAAAKYGHLASFKECARAHSVFHRAAGKVAQCVNHGLVAQAEELMSNAYLAASNDAIVAIQRLKRETLEAAESTGSSP